MQGAQMRPACNVLLAGAGLFAILLPFSVAGLDHFGEDFIVPRPADRRAPIGRDPGQTRPSLPVLRKLIARPAHAFGDGLAFEARQQRGAQDEGELAVGIGGGKGFFDGGAQ
jgi:hypothetical protein